MTGNTTTYNTTQSRILVIIIQPPVIHGIAIVSRDINIDPFVFSAGGFQPVARVDVAVILAILSKYGSSDSLNFTLTYWLNLPDGTSLPKYVESYVQKYGETVTYTLTIPIPAPGDYTFVAQASTPNMVSGPASQKFTVSFVTFYLGTFLIVAIIAAFSIVGVTFLTKRKREKKRRRMRSF